MALVVRWDYWADIVSGECHERGRQPGGRQSLIGNHAAFSRIRASDRNVDTRVPRGENPVRSSN